MNYFNRSQGGGIFAFLQGIDAYHDHLVLRNPGRLTFLTPLNNSGLIEKLSRTSSHTLEHIKDTLEVFRVLANVGGDQASSLLTFAEDVLNQKPSPNRQLLIWVCRYLMQAPDPEKMPKLSGILEDLCKEALAAKGAEILRKCPKASYTADLQDFVNGREDVESHGSWGCPLCASVLASLSYDSAACGSGHRWPRCCLTLRICDGPSLLACRWCGVIASPDVPEGVETVCPYCSGPLLLYASCS